MIALLITTLSFAGSYTCSTGDGVRLEVEERDEPVAPPPGALVSLATLHEGEREGVAWARYAACYDCSEQLDDEVRIAVVHETDRVYELYEYTWKERVRIQWHGEATRRVVTWKCTEPTLDADERKTNS